MPKRDSFSTSEMLSRVVEHHRTDVVSLEELVSVMHGRGFAFMLVLFSFPTALPLPYPPGFTTLTGIPLVIFSFQIMLGMDVPWLPRWVAKKTFKRTTLATMIAKTAPYLRKVEGLMRQRLTFMCSDVGERIIGCISLLCAISITLPIMFGNAIPSAGILIMSLGLLGRDGIVVGIGVLVGLIGLLVATLVVAFIGIGVEKAVGFF